MDPLHPSEPLAPILKPPSLPPWEEAAQRRHDGLLGHLQHLIESINETRRLIHLHAPKEPLGRTVVLSTQPWKANRRGYRYLRIWSTSAAALVVDVGAGPIAQNLVVGWNNVDYPEGTTVTCAAGANVYVLLTDYTPASAQ